MEISTFFAKRKIQWRCVYFTDIENTSETNEIGKDIYEMCIGKNAPCKGKLLLI